jgi:uncharacterized membrane protein
VRIIPLIIGLCLVLISVPGYLDTPALMSQMIHSFMSSMTGSSIPGTGGGSILKQMGYPSRTVVIPLIQYSFVGLGAVGIGFIAFGAIAKKVKKQFEMKLVAEEQETIKEIHTEPSPKDERLQTNLRSLRILQERLAKGEITSNEFHKLKKLLE